MIPNLFESKVYPLWATKPEITEPSNTQRVPVEQDGNHGELEVKFWDVSESTVHKDGETTHTNAHTVVSAGFLGVENELNAAELRVTPPIRNEQQRQNAIAMTAGLLGLNIAMKDA